MSSVDVEGTNSATKMDLTLGTVWRKEFGLGGEVWEQGSIGLLARLIIERT